MAHALGNRVLRDFANVARLFPEGRSRALGVTGSRAMLENIARSIVVRIVHVQHGYGENGTILMTFSFFFIFMISGTGR